MRDGRHLRVSSRAARLHTWEMPLSEIVRRHGRVLRPPMAAVGEAIHLNFGRPEALESAREALREAGFRELAEPFGSSGRLIQPVRGRSAVARLLRLAWGVEAAAVAAGLAPRPRRRRSASAPTPSPSVPAPPGGPLAHLFGRHGYVRRQDADRRAAEGYAAYKKGDEVRLVATSEAELACIRAELERAGFKPGRPFRKAGQYRQPIYGREEVARFLSLVGRAADA